MSMTAAFFAAAEAANTVSSSNSEISSLSGYTRRMAFPKSNVQIRFDNHFSSKVYTSGSPVSGTVGITTQRDVRFDSIQILLIGATRTRADGVGSQSESSHTFLKLSMPVPETAYPVPRVLETGRTLNLPFNFVVPHYLTIGACNHHVASEPVRDHHVRLPPSMGFWERDDMAPDMARVEYSVKARVFREPEMGGPAVKVMEASQQIRVLPASLEDPPLSVAKHDKQYRLTKTKTLRKSLLAGKLGRVTATAVQPEAAHLRPDGLGISSTNAQVHLHFEPAAPEIPAPKVTSVSAKVTSHTYFASGPISGFPNLGDWNRSYSADRRGSYQTSVNLFSQAVDHFRWTQYANQQRRDSGYSSDAAHGTDDDDDVPAAATRRRGSNKSKSSSSSNRRRSAAAATAAGHVGYTAILQVPIKLPLAKKTFLPTFHSCIASRVYVLHLAVTLGSGSSTGSATTINLAVPLQVAVDLADAALDAALPSFETAVEDAEVDEYLRPRRLTVPDEQFRETSVLPGYGDLESWRRERTAAVR